MKDLSNQQRRELYEAARTLCSGCEVEATDRLIIRIARAVYAASHGEGMFGSFQVALDAIVEQIPERPELLAKEDTSNTHVASSGPFPMHVALPATMYDPDNTHRPVTLHIDFVAPDKVQYSVFIPNKPEGD